MVVTPPPVAEIVPMPSRVSEPVLRIDTTGPPPPGAEEVRVPELVNVLSFTVTEIMLLEARVTSAFTFIGPALDERRTWPPLRLRVEGPTTPSFSKVRVLLPLGLIVIEPPLLRIVGLLVLSGRRMVRAWGLLAGLPIVTALPPAVLVAVI